MGKKRVVIGMSGGVDSSVAAKILIDIGFDVVGLFMHNWEEQDDDGACTSTKDWQDAQAVCGKLGIPIYSKNFSKEYMERVFSYFLDEYKKGRTPNPDVLCNREIKFGPFAEFAKNLGADYIATGHYCDIQHFENDTHLLKANDENKDQTYFLNQVKTSQLTNVIFPIANLDKAEVRRIAEQNGLITATKKDSTGICFIGERKFKEFLAKYLPAKSGKIVDLSGNILGSHDGLMYHTIGQRKGLGIGGVAGQDQNRWYVVKKDLKSNELIVSNGEGEELFSDTLIAEDINFIGKFDFNKSFDCTAKCRYRQKEQACHVEKLEQGYKVTFADPQRAITEGQYVVLYKDNRCLGGGVIESTNRKI